jgi:hypothetical protein
MNYSELRKVNVNDHVERKNGLSYISWSWAVDQLLQLDSEATWSYGEPVRFGETLMVFCTVNAFGKARTAQLPVMNFRNQAIPNPDAMAVNTAMQRCLAKAIALHGIGLYIYAGEDLPEGEDAAKKPDVEPPKQKITPTAGALDGFSKDEIEILNGLAEEIEEYMETNLIDVAFRVAESLDNDQKTALWSLLGSTTRSALKKYKQSMKE